MIKVYNSVLSCALLGLLMTSCNNQSQKADNNDFRQKKVETEIAYDESPLAEKDATFLFYNEFAKEGDVLKIKGGQFTKGAAVKVLFHNGTDFAIESPKAELKSQNEIWAVVPAGVAESHPVKIVSGTTELVTDVLYKDTRNVIVNFDSKREQLFISGSVEKYPALFGEGATGDYGVFDDIRSWQAVVYQSARVGAEAEHPTVFGPFTKDIVDGKINIREFAIKFEVNVNKSNPIIGEAFEFGFCNGNDEDPIGNVRNCAAYWCASEYIWNKDLDQWEIDSAKPFSTDGWMTVTIPFTELLWKSKNMSICADAANNGKYVNAAWTDYKHHYSYAQLNPNPEDVAKWGGLSINVNEYGSCFHQDRYKVAIDNIRIVPDDGAGALYLKKDYGVAKRHYDKR